MGLFDNRRAETPEWQSDDPKIRRGAVPRLADPAILSQLAQGDADEEVRRRALQALQELALTDNQEPALKALEAITEENALVVVARQAAQEEVARAALLRLSTPHALALAAQKGSHPAVRRQAVELLNDFAELGQVAVKAEDRDVAMAALTRIEAALAESGPDDASLLEVLGSVAERARNKVAARRARALLRGGEAEHASAQPKRATDRARQKELCEIMEALGQSRTAEGLQRRIEEVRGDWIDLIPLVDADYEERFDAAWHAAKEHLVLVEREERERGQREAEAARIHAERVVPRLALIRRVESPAGEDAGLDLAEIRAEWDRIRFLDTQEGEALQARFDKACAALEKRLEARTAEEKARLAREEKETARREKERFEREGLRRLEQICVRGERLLSAEAPTLKAATRALREVRAALESPGPYPSPKEKSAIRARLSKILAGLSPRLDELRQSEAWKLWANEGVQENLCVMAEALVAVEDPVEAGKRLTELQTRWRQASTASREKSQELWLRFKAARDALRSRLELDQRSQGTRKEELCSQAEALTHSTDWIPTAEALKRLQKEWQSVGSAGRSRDRLLWQRFRAACDGFFTRRKEDLKQRKEVWSKNLLSRVALCEQAEALADSSDWEATAGILKKLQMDWKAVGPVGRKDSEATWRRFRGACDRFFERYKRRHEIEREGRITAREKICAEMEGLLPKESALPPEDLAARLLSLRKRWSESGAVPAPAAQALEERFRQAMDGIITAFPEAMRGTELDASTNRQKMEDLIAQVEKLMPERNVVDHSALSPATRLATLWVEAMAANTIGGTMAENAELRAAQDEVRRAQAAWEKIGYVPAAARRELSERFQRACARFPRPAPVDTARPTPARPASSPRRPR